jgi:hypothetical protein
MTTIQVKDIFEADTAEIANSVADALNQSPRVTLTFASLTDRALVGAPENAGTLLGEIDAHLLTHGVLYSTKQSHDQVVYIRKGPRYH